MTPIPDMECPDCSRVIDAWDVFSATVLETPMSTTETINCPQCGQALIAHREVDVAHWVERKNA